jgi:hypothetical protein
MLLQQDYLFTAVVSHERLIEANKINYYLALNKTQKSWKTTKEDISPWLLFFLEVIKNQSNQALKIIEGDNFEHALSDKQLILWRWATTRQKEFGRKDAIDELQLPARTIETIIKKLSGFKPSE